MNDKLIKILGMSATIMGIGVTLINDWVADKKLDKKIDEKINEALTKMNKKES